MFEHSLMSIIISSWWNSNTGCVLSTHKVTTHLSHIRKYITTTPSRPRQTMTSQMAFSLTSHWYLRHSDKHTAAAMLKAVYQSHVASMYTWHYVMKICCPCNKPPLYIRLDIKKLTNKLAEFCAQVHVYCLWCGSIDRCHGPRRTWTTRLAQWARPWRHICDNNLRHSSYPSFIVHQKYTMFQWSFDARLMTSTVLVDLQSLLPGVYRASIQNDKWFPFRRGTESWPYTSAGADMLLLRRLPDDG